MNKTADICADCGLGRREHHLDGAAYGVCGQFSEVTHGPLSPVPADLLTRLRDFVATESKRWVNCGTGELERIEVSPAGKLAQEAVEAIESAEWHHGYRDGLRDGRKISEAFAPAQQPASPENVDTLAAELQSVIDSFEAQRVKYGNLASDPKVNDVNQEIWASLANEKTDDLRVLRKLLSVHGHPQESGEPYEDGLATAVAEYARDIRRNSSGSDDYPWELMRGCADYLDTLVARHPAQSPTHGALVERAKDCALYDFDSIEMVECNWALWQDIINALSVTSTVTTPIENKEGGAS